MSFSKIIDKLQKAIAACAVIGAVIESSRQLDIVEGALIDSRVIVDYSITRSMYYCGIIINYFVYYRVY